MPLFFSTTPARRPVGDPGDIFLRTIGNHNTLGHLRVVVDADIEVPHLVSVSVLGALRVTTGGDLDILVERIASTSVPGDIEVQESPPDGFIRLVRIEDGDTLGDLEVQESPPDGFIRLVRLVNASVPGDISVLTDAELVVADEEGIGTAPVGDTVV